ncbi:hypothetical protein AB0L40_17970 [Patulibacter sp. NPDC049589]|uniref:hypothetical protein n=1 Tax=Patulibacter sp. NPDC049589 TaxID=3154731 RepID=UPI00343C8DC8
MQALVDGSAGHLGEAVMRRLPEKARGATATGRAGDGTRGRRDARAPGVDVEDSTVRFSFSGKKDRTMERALALAVRFSV